MNHILGEFGRYFDDCLALIEAGKADIDSAVARYPQHADELRAQLEVALWFHKRRDAVAPRPEFLSASRSRLVSKVKRHQRSQASPTILDRIKQYLNAPTLAPVAFVVLLMVLLIANGTVVSLSENALPGDSFYGTKLILEEFALVTSLDDANDAQLNIHFVRRRLVEFNKLLVERRYEQVDETVSAYEDQVNRTLETINALSSRDSQRLAFEFQKVFSEQEPILTRLGETVPISVIPAVAKAVAVSHSGQQAAQEMAQIGPQQPDPTITPFPPATRTPIPTQTPRPTPTPAPILTTAPTLVPTSVPTSVPTPTEDEDKPPVVPTTAPSATPTPLPPTNTPLPPTVTPLPPTDTPLPPTNTPPPTPTPAPTFTPPPTPTATPSNTPLPTATNTPLPPPTDAPLPPTSAPTNTPAVTTTSAATPMNNPATSPTPTSP